MRVLVICSQFPPRPSPESNHSMLLCEALAGSGTEAHLLTSPLLPGAPEPRGYSLHPVMESWGWGGARHLMRVARGIRPDVILLIYLGWIYHKYPMITFAPSFLRLERPCRTAGLREKSQKSTLLTMNREPTGKSRVISLARWPVSPNIPPAQ
jgi:hypothetical protein